MYNDYFGFRETPFSIAPDPRYLFMTDQHREALAHLVYGLNSDGGCILLTGEVGTGKTTVCRCLLNQIPDGANIALVLNPKVTASELLATVCDELDIDCPENASIKTYVDRINRFLIDSHARGEKTVLIIDEAQNLDPTVLEQLRLLTNLETDKKKLLQIIILGQPELLDILSSDDMRQLAQRITARFHLKPLSREEVKAYVSHRLAVAGQNVQLFPDAAIKRLYQLSHGIPRLINILCDRALLGAYVQNQPNVDVKTLDQAAKEVFGEIRTVTEKKQKKPGPMLFATAALLLIVIAALIYTGVTMQPAPDAAQPPLDAVAATNTGASVIDDSIETPALPAKAKPAEPDQASTEQPQPPATTTAATTKPSTNVGGNINDFLSELIARKGDNTAAAYRALFRLWGRDFDPERDATACQRASETGLSCLHKMGNLNSLRKINRPAILKLYDRLGKASHVVLTSLQDKQATLDTGEQQFTVNTDELDHHWLGEYSLLWQPPPFYKNALTPGNNGPMVQWLDQQMARLYDQGGAPTISDNYDGELIDKVKRFQLSKGLIPDGIAGPLTFIHLNTELGENTPLLYPSKAS